MEYASYEIKDNYLAPAEVKIGEAKTPVWIQQRWQEGEWALYVRKNGCGHCCAAMALTLRGVAINPHEEYELCRRLWGAPRDEGERRQGNFQSSGGIKRILNHFGVRAECYGIPDREAAIRHILSALEDGKLVIFESHARADNPDNPFSRGEHWVMAVGFTESGEILVADSSELMGRAGYHLVDADTIMNALYLGADYEDMTWGEWRDDFLHGVCYLIVGDRAEDFIDKNV